MAERLENIAKALVYGWTIEQGITLTPEQRFVLSDAVARTLQAVQDEERKGFRGMLRAAIETCKKANLREGVRVLEAVLQADVESEARQDGAS